MALPEITRWNAPNRRFEYGGQSPANKRPLAAGDAKFAVRRSKHDAPNARI